MTRMAESGSEADARRLNVLLQPDGRVLTPPRLAGWNRSLIEAALSDIRRAGRGGELASDVLEFLDALQQSEMSVNGRLTGGFERIDVSGEGGESLTSARVAEVLECTDRTVRRAFEAGRLRGRKLGHEWVTTRADLDEYRFGKRGK